tara:strand:+ start:2060 stop:2245 length:186 start_codon:yes stop_codon:yes gene_type:complete
LLLALTVSLQDRGSINDKKLLLSWETLKITVIITITFVITSAIPAFEANKSALQSRLSGKG